jgi:hypothetical protein
VFRPGASFVTLLYNELIALRVKAWILLSAFLDCPIGSKRRKISETQKTFLPLERKSNKITFYSPKMKREKTEKLKTCGKLKARKLID